MEAVRTEMSCNSAPGQSGCTPIGGKDTTYRLTGGNSITQYRPSADILINGTSGDHMLRDGYVVRWIAADAAGDVRIWTFGVGENTNWATRWFNQNPGAWIFKFKQDQNVENVQRKLK